MIEEFDGVAPTVDPTAWVHAGAHIIGDVRLGKQVSVWPGAILRGDMGPIIVDDESNVQDGAMCHDTGGLSETRIGKRVTVGHGAILHGCIVEDFCLIGMGSILLDNCVVGTGSIVAAGSLVPARMVIPPGSLVMGSPAKVVRPANDKDRQRIDEGWQVYVAVSRRYRGER